MNLEYLCNYIVRISRCPVRIYNSKNKLKKVLGLPNNEEYLKPELQTQLLETKENYPILTVSDDNIIYGMAVVKDQKIIMGPNFISKESSNKLIAYSPLEVFCENILLIHNFYHKKQIYYDELLIKNFMTEEFLFKINKAISGDLIEINWHNPYDRELRIMRSIRVGDLKSLKKALNEKFTGNYGTMAKNHLRSIKNLAICHICLSSRAAIEGGVPFEIAYSICDNFVIKLEEIGKIEQAYTLEKEAQFYLCELVDNRRNNKDISKNMLIDQCKNIIAKKINDNIKVEDIAKELYVNKEYLSRVFSKGEKITIKNYILREKIELSKDMLIYHKYSFGQIALFLHFYSQSHYIKTFKKFMGVTPKQFKDEYGKK